MPACRKFTDADLMKAIELLDRFDGDSEAVIQLICVAAACGKALVLAFHKSTEVNHGECVKAS